MPHYKRTISREYYQHFVNAFITEGKNYSRVAHIMDCDNRTARKAWVEGWTDVEPWARPIADVYAEHVKVKNGENPASAERASEPGTEFAGPGVGTVNADKPRAPEAKAELVRVVGDGEISRMLENAITQVKANVAQALLAEQTMIATARNNLTGILVLSDKLLAGLMPIVDTVVERLRTMASDSNTDPKKVLSLIDRVIKINASTVTAGAKLLEMQRLMTGMPQSIHEQRQTPPAAPESTNNTDAARLELANRLERQLRALRDKSDPYTPGESKLPEVEDPPLDASENE